MAASQEEIISVYKAVVSGYVKEIDEIIKKVRQLTGEEDKQKQNAIVGARSLTDSAAQRKKLLTDEIANLKKLQEQSKKAFTVPEIQSFNSQIAQSKNNIALLSGETGKLHPIVQQLKTQFGLLGAGVLAAFSINAIKNFAESSVAAFNEQAKAEKELLGALNGRKDVQERLIIQAKELQESVLIPDEVIESQQAFLALQGLSEEQIKKTITAAAQLAAVTGIDFQGAVQQLSGTFEGVTGRLGKLDSQIKDFTKSELANGAVVDLINKKYAGFAETAANIGTGPITRLKLAFNDLREIIGGRILTALSGVVVGLDEIVKGAQKFLEVPLSGKLEEERVGLNALVLQITATNTNQEQRNKLINELQKTYPAFLENLNAETVTNEQLRGRLVEVNKQLLNKIVLQRAQEDVNKQTEKAASLAISQSDKEAELAKRISLLVQTYNDELSPAQKTAIDQQDTLIKKGQELSKALSQQQATQKRSGELVTISQQAITRLDAAIVGILNTQNQFNNANKENADLIERRNRLAKEFNISLEEEATATAAVVTPTDELNKILKLSETTIENLTSKKDKLDALFKTLTLGTTEFAKAKTELDRLNAAIKSLTETDAEKRNKALEEEKKLIEQINKLRLETAPETATTIFQKTKPQIEFEINVESLKKVEDDTRSLAQIQLAIDKQKNDLLRLNAEKLILDLKVTDEKRIADIRKRAEDEIKIANDARIKQSEAEQKIADDQLQKQFQQEDELTKILLQHKINNLQEGSVEQLKAQKELLDFEQTQAEQAAKKEFNNGVINKQTLNDRLLGIETEFGDKKIALDDAITQSQIENLEKIANAASEIFSVIAEISANQAQSAINDLEAQKEARDKDLDDELNSLESQKDKKLISERTFEKQSALIKQQRINAEKEIDAKIRAIKKKQAEDEKRLKIFNILITTAQKEVELFPDYVLMALAAALAALEIAAVSSQPVPLAKGTKDKKESGLALVGEQGQELVHLPSAAQVLPSPKTKKNKEIINAMFDDNLDEYISKKYVKPEIRKEKISTQKKYEILKQVYEKQAVDNYNKSVLEKYDFVKKENINRIVNNYVNNILTDEKITNEIQSKISNELNSKRNELNQLLNEAKITFSSDKKENIITQKEKLISEIQTIENKISNIRSFADNIERTKKELYEVLNENKIIHSNIVTTYETTSAIKNNIISEIKETVLKNIIYNKQFEKSINTDYVSRALEDNRAKIETKKQESFAENIANAFVLNSKTEIKSGGMTENEYMYLHTNPLKRLRKKEMDYLSESIAEKLAEKLR